MAVKVTKMLLSVCIRLCKTLISTVMQAIAMPEHDRQGWDQKTTWHAMNNKYYGVSNVQRMQSRNSCTGLNSCDLGRIGYRPTKQLGQIDAILTFADFCIPGLPYQGQCQTWGGANEYKRATNERWTLAGLECREPRQRQQKNCPVDEFSAHRRR